MHNEYFNANKKKASKPRLSKNSYYTCFNQYFHSTSRTLCIQSFKHQPVVKPNNFRNHNSWLKYNLMRLFQCCKHKNNDF